MVTASEVFGQYFEASPPVQKQLQTLPPPVAKGAMGGLVAVAGAAGFLLTPSRRIAVNAVGGALAANVGNLARKRLADERQKAAVPAVASLLAEGLPKVTPEALGAIATEYDVPKKQFETQCAELYLTFLNACLTSHEVQTAELSDLLRLQTLLRLTAAQTGTQIYAAARQLYSRHRAYLEDSEPSDSKKLLEKFVFLAERILSRDDSPEGYRYESLRLQKLFSLSTPTWKDMAENAAVPFYAKALTSSVLEGKPVTAKNLAAVRQSLGIVEQRADDMHSDVYAKAAGGMLEAAGAFAAADKERLAAVQTLLAMPPATANRALQTLTSPLYSSTFDGVLAELEALPADADDAYCTKMAASLEARQAELLLGAPDAYAIETLAMRTKAAGSLAAAVKLLRAQNLPQGLEEVQGLVTLCERVSKFMVAIGHVDGPAEAALPALFGGLKGSMKQSEVLALYRVLLLHYLEKLKIDEAEAASLERLRAMLELSDAEATSVYQAAAGPLFRQAVETAVASASLGDEAKKELDASIANLALPSEVTKAIAVDIYTEKLQGFGENKILDEEQSAELATLRAFLSIEMDDVYGAHEAVCAGAYRTSVKEVMGTSGIIPDEYWDGLSKLRERLGLSEESAQSLFAVEVTQKMKAFGDKAVEAMEEKANKQQSGAADDDDTGTGTLGIQAGAIATEVLALVDFAVASKVLMTKDAAGKEFEVCGANLRDEFEDRTLKELYKNYLIEAFSGSNPAANQRLFDNLPRLALVLGLQENEVMVIHNGIGSYILRDYIGKALKKGPLGQEETQFIGSIKDVLGMEQSKCDELVADQQMSLVSIMIEQMFEKSNVIAKDVREVRDTADLYDIDLVDDLQISGLKLNRMFLCELEDLVDGGTLQPDDLGALAEICEPLHISEEKASAMLEETVQKRVSSGVLQAAAAKRQSNTKNAAAEIDRALKFAALLPDIVADAKSVSPNERNELYMVYQASQLTAGGATAESAEQLELLKSVLGLAAAAPA